MDYDFEGLFAENREDWEPSEPLEWVNIDPLANSLRYAQIHLSAGEQEFASFHSAFKRCPPEIRKQIFREREIAAKLVRLLPVWRKRISTLFAVGVGLRLAPDPRLVAVVTVDGPLTTGEWFEIRQDWARSESGESVVGDYRERKGEIVPIFADLRPVPTLLGQVPEGSFLFGDPDPSPADSPVIQSGDKVGSESPAGVREFGTLSCIVSEPNSTVPLVLGSGHVFLRENYELITARAGTTRVGRVKTVKMDCDAAIATLRPPYLCDFRLKVSDLVPAAPVLATNDLAVQLYGAVSLAQTGFLNQVDIIPANATAVGIFPLFSADIKCTRGDSGALLVTGKGKAPPVLAWQKKHMSPAYLESMTCAILGLLMAGPQPDTDPMLRPQAYFSPALQVFNDLGVEAWVR
jgi:hypothetical protein